MTSISAGTIGDTPIGGVRQGLGARRISSATIGTGTISQQPVEPAIASVEAISSAASLITSS